MYYCKSSFYVPKLRRWLNADNINYLEPDNINGLNLFMYCANDPVNLSDDNGNMPKWLKTVCLGLAAAVVVGLGIAVMVASGGSAAVALTSVISASVGVASSSTALTVTSFAFVGATSAFICSNMMTSRSDDMLSAGPNVLGSTVIDGVYRGVGGYYAWNDQVGNNESWSKIRRDYWKSKGYDKTPKDTDNKSYVLHHPYGRYGKKIYVFKEMTQSEHINYHRNNGYGRGNGGYCEPY